HVDRERVPGHAEEHGGGDVVLAARLRQPDEDEAHDRDGHRGGEQQPGDVRGEASARVGVDERLRAGCGGHQLAPENALRRLTTIRARALTMRVMANSMRPVAMSTLTLVPYASGKLRAMLAAIVEGLPELMRLKVTSPVAESTMATAIVSPSARPSPSIEAEMMPARPKGNTVIRIISQRVAPSASAASSCSFGVCRNTSRLMAVMIGSTMTASTTAAVRMVRPVPEGGPAKRGIQEKLSHSHT